MFAYVAGSSFVLEDVYGVSPQAFSLVFVVNSAGLIAVSQLSGHIVGRVGPPTLLRWGVCGVAFASAGTLIVTLSHAGLAGILVFLFLILAANGLVFPNATAGSLAGQEEALGSASALLGMGQFGTGAVVAPLVGLGGPHNAVPMAVVIAACGLSALGVNLALSPAAGTRDAAPARNVQGVTEISSRAEVSTDKPVPYMRQLCKHFGHKVDASFGEDSGYIRFDFGRCELQAADGKLTLSVSAADEESHARMERVIGSHLERFGRRDGLSVAWSG